MMGYTTNADKSVAGELEQGGFILRKIYAEVLPKVEYPMSEFGKTLEPVLLALKNRAKEQILPGMN